MHLTSAQRLKFQLFEHGLKITETARARLLEAAGSERLSSADFASTTGIILQLDDNVWVNAPINDHNANFVGDSPFVFDQVGGVFVVRGAGLESQAKYWPQPSFHKAIRPDSSGRPFTDYVVTHGDRARLSPIHGCGMACTFCDVPYAIKYGMKVVPTMVDAVRLALEDPVQPARHLLISGGTPRVADIGWLKEVYRTILETFPTTDIDIMMVPTGDLLDVDELKLQGVHQLSVNLELFSNSAARRFMPQKHRQGREHYLGFIERAAAKLGPGRVRSMLMVGLEPAEETLDGVKAIAERGGVPVLSPFRPDPSTPLRSMLPPGADLLEAVFLRASEIVARLGSKLGPSCIPCSHNTLTLAARTEGLADYTYPLPHLI